MAEWGDRLGNIVRDSKGRLSPNKHFSACPDAEAIVRHIDPRAQFFKASLGNNLDLKEAPVEGLDLWPTARGWVRSEDLWTPMEGVPGIAVSDVQAMIGYHEESNELAGLRGDKDCRPFASLTADRTLHVDMPEERSLAVLAGMNAVIKKMGERAANPRSYAKIQDDAARWLRPLNKEGQVIKPGDPIALNNKMPLVSFSGFALVTEAGQKVWSDDQGCVYRLRSAPAGLIGIQDDAVVWASGLPRSGLLGNARIYGAESVEHLTRYLLSSGLRLDPANLDEIKRHGHNLANGLPVARSNIHLDEVEAGDGRRWKRVLSPEHAAAMPGEDRFWQMQELVRMHGGRSVWRDLNIGLSATPRRQEGSTVAALEGDSTVTALRTSTATVASLVAILNESRMTLPAPALAAIGIRIEDGRHVADISDLAASQANLVEHGDLALRWMPGAGTNWAIVKNGPAGGSAPLGVVTLSARGTWAMKLDVQPDDLREFMADLSGAMHRLEEFPTLERAGVEAAPEHHRLVAGHA